MLGPQQISGSNIRLGTLEIRYCRTNCLIENENISVMEAFMKRFEVATWFTLKGVLKAKYIHHKIPEKKHWLYCGSEVIQGYSLCEFFLVYNKASKFRTLRILKFQFRIWGRCSLENFSIPSTKGWTTELCLGFTRSTPGTTAAVLAVFVFVF